MSLVKNSHATLVRACLDVLEFNGFLAWTNHSVAVKLANGGYLKTGRPGLPDICAVIPGGRTLFVECKVGKDKVRPVQEQFMAAATNQGALCLLVKDDVGVLVDAIMELKRQAME